MHDTAWALHLALLNAGSNIAAKIAMIAITTRSSMSVKPVQGFGWASLGPPQIPRRQPHGCFLTMAIEETSKSKLGHFVSQVFSLPVVLYFMNESLQLFQKTEALN